MSIAPPAPPPQPAAPPPPAQEPPNQALIRALEAAKAKRTHEAIGICKDVLTAFPGRPGALGLLGGILGQVGQTEEAIALLEQAVAQKPDVANWRLSLCTLYRSRNRLDEALRHGLEAVRCSKPGSSASHVEVALTYLVRGQRDLAIKYFREGIGQEPEAAAPHMGLGELLLSEGEFQPGWLEYAWRNKLEQARGMLPKMVAAPWNGMRMPGGRILVIADQGFGDAIQFARYLPMVKARVGHVILGWGLEIVGLFSGHPSVDEYFTNWSDAPAHDAYVLLSSLPQIFQTEVDTVPKSVPYVHASEERSLLWEARLSQILPRGSLRVGLVWSGRPTHPNNARRSIRLDTLAPLLEHADVDFVTLQKPFPQEDRAFAARFPNLHDVSVDLNSFGDTAAIIENIDLVIAVDTAVAHLAGAMGRETYVLIPKPADWRWLLDREDSIWYPTLRLFRQDEPGVWAKPVAALSKALEARKAKPSNRAAPSAARTSQ